MPEWDDINEEEFVTVVKTGFIYDESHFWHDNGSGALHLPAGGAITAVDAVMDDKVDNVYALTRPPGHHAEDRFDRTHRLKLRH